MVVCPEINHGELIPRKVSTATARWICFRTPREIKEFGNLPKWRISSHPKAVNYRQKWGESFSIQIGIVKGLKFATNLRTT